MEIKYGVTGKDRKALVMAIAEITGADAIYKGVPTCNYEVDYFTVDKIGTLFFDDLADCEEVEHLLEELAKRGFVGQQEGLEEPEQGFDGLAVSLPIDKVNVYNLENLLESKKNYFIFTLAAYVVKWFEGLSEVDVENRFGKGIRIIFEISNIIVANYVYPHSI